MSRTALPGEDRVPMEFMSQLNPPDPATPEALASAAGLEMLRALEMAPGERDAAYALLAADAYMTWACAVAVDEGAESHAFSAILQRFLSALEASSP